MDSITQFVLGSTLAIAISPIKTPKMALVGGLIATIPDLDIFLNHGSDLDNIVNHRGFSHSLFYLTCLSPFIALLAHKLFQSVDYFKWLFISWTVLITHPLLDSFTIFGTSLFLPFSDFKVMTGSIFIIDPIYTIPLLISTIYLFTRKTPLVVFNRNFNSIALIFSHIYLTLTFIIQQTVMPPGKAIATPTPFNAFQWRTVTIDDNNITQQFVDLFGNKSSKLLLPNNNPLSIHAPESTETYSHFSNGFYNIEISNDKLILIDLRMGRIDKSVFKFVIAELIDDEWAEVTPYRIKSNVNLNELYDTD